VKLRAYRILQNRHTQTAFSGEGAASYPGRWNFRGDRVVYCSSSLSLATLEILVNIGRPDSLNLYSWIEISFPSTLVHKPTHLPRNWRENPIPISARNLGQEWYTNKKSAILQVPSAVVPEEYNYILNPAHEGFSKVKIGDTRQLRWDSRLVLE
jgi:RES domain-containing protein